MTLEVVALDSNVEKEFLNHVNNDPLEYYWFIVDWKFNKVETKIHLAMEEDKIQGLLLTYGEKIAAIRGNREAAELLLEHLTLRNVEMTVPRDCKDLLFRKYTGGLRSEIVLMHLDKGAEKIRKVCEPVRLTEEDAEDIVTLLRGSSPGGWWEDLRVQQVSQKMNETYWIGIKSDHKLVSVGSTRFVNFGSNVGVVATDEAHRNKGYATTIVSSLVEEIFKRCDKALIHVLKDNAPAIRTYQKVGFKPYNSYFLLKDGIRI